MTEGREDKGERSGVAGSEGAGDRGCSRRAPVSFPVHELGLTFSHSKRQKPSDNSFASTSHLMGKGATQMLRSCEVNRK